MKASLENKIAVLITIPLLAFVALSGFYLYNNWVTYQEAKRSLQITNLFDSSAKLIKNLQQERSNIGLLLIETIKLEEVKKQRPIVDANLLEFKGLLKESTISEKLKTSQEKTTEDINALREKLDKEISGEIFESYNEIINRLILFEVGISRQIPLASIQSSLLSVNIIEQSRESAAQLQSMLLPILLANAPLSAVSITKMEKLYSGISGNLESSLLDISPEVQKNIATFKQNEDWGMISLIYSSILSKSAEGRYGIDLGGFNETMAKAVLLLDGPVNQIMAEIKSQVENITNNTTRSALFMSIGILVSLLIIFIIVKSFTSVLSKNLVNIAETLLGGAEGVMGSSQEMATAADGLSKATANQAESLQRTTASVEEISAQIKLNAENGVRASELSNKTKIAALKGESEITNLISAMEEIAGSSKKIEDILTVIDDISFQTNLLALNASVEAARAGEQGKGFAVVAEAVRTLAQKSASSAREIGDLVRENVDKTHRGSQIANASRTALNDIIDNVNKVAVINNEIANASVDQSKAIEDITITMNNLDQITHKNTETSQSAAQSAEGLSNQSASLKESIASLVKIVHGE